MQDSVFRALRKQYIQIISNDYFYLCASFRYYFLASYPISCFSMRLKKTWCQNLLRLKEEGTSKLWINNFIMEVTWREHPDLVIHMKITNVQINIICVLMESIKITFFLSKIFISTKYGESVENNNWETLYKIGAQKYESQGKKD